jgi:hypothetical protein
MGVKPINFQSQKVVCFHVLSEFPYNQTYYITKIYYPQIKMFILTKKNNIENLVAFTIMQIHYQCHPFGLDDLKEKHGNRISMDVESYKNRYM